MLHQASLDVQMEFSRRRCVKEPEALKVLCDESILYFLNSSGAISLRERLHAWNSWAVPSEM